MMVGRVVAGLGTGMNTATAGVCRTSGIEWLLDDVANISPGLAKRDEQDAKPWQTRYHPDGELHHWLQY